MFHAVRITILTIFILVAFAASGMAQSESTVRRAAFDIGSANIKCTVADVDIMTGMIENVVTHLSRKVDFAEDMARSYDGNLSKEILEQGTAAITEMIETAREEGATDFSAVGGATFRKARNGRAYFNTLEQTLGIHTRIISKQQSSLLTYHAVSQSEAAQGGNFIVWDIGGDSMEMTLRNRDRSLTFYVDPLASVSFKNTVIRAIQKRDLDTVTTPNPMSAGDVELALTYAQMYAEAHVMSHIRSRMKQESLTVIGIGGVHYYSIPALTGTDTAPFTREAINSAIKEWTGKPDEAFDSKYANTRLTNAILVLGFMKALGIDEITPLKVNQADGLLVAPEFW